MNRFGPIVVNYRSAPPAGNLRESIADHGPGWVHSLVIAGKASQDDRERQLGDEVESLRRAGRTGGAGAIRVAAGGGPYAGGTPLFGAAHTGGLVVRAVSRSGPVGVGIEAHARAGEIHELRGAFMPPRERRSAPTGARAKLACVLRAWTVKEASFKALGTGPKLALDLVTVSDAGEAWHVLDERRPGEGGRWRAWTADGRGHAVTVCEPSRSGGGVWAAARGAFGGVWW